MNDYRYRADVLDALGHYGIMPKPTTPPARVHEFLSDLYRYELRRLRARLLSGDVSRAHYYDHVVALRRKYPLVSLKPEFWTEAIGDAGSRA